MAKATIKFIVLFLIMIIYQMLWPVTCDHERRICKYFLTRKYVLSCKYFLNSKYFYRVVLMYKYLTDRDLLDLRHHSPWGDKIKLKLSKRSVEEINKSMNNLLIFSLDLRPSFQQLHCLQQRMILMKMMMMKDMFRKILS